jgi:hypothetical protein
MTYLRQLRLTRAHEELMTADPDDTTVTAVARKGDLATTVASRPITNAASGASHQKHCAPTQFGHAAVSKVVRAGFDGGPTARAADRRCREPIRLA